MTEEKFGVLKKSLNFMSGEFSNIFKQQQIIMELMGDIRELKRQQVEKDKRIALLECQVTDLEQYSRINYIIISGLATRQVLYAWAVTPADTGDCNKVDQESLEQQIAAFFNDKGISISNHNIKACHRLPLTNKHKDNKQAKII